MGYTVYKQLDAEGGVLYVGCTTNLRSRTYSHRYRSGWASAIATVEVAAFFPGWNAESLALACAHETALIKELRPAFNKRALTAATESGSGYWARVDEVNGRIALLDESAGAA